MSAILDAMDHLSTAYSLVDLIGMTTRWNPGDDERAIGAGCIVIMEHLEACRDLLKEAQRTLDQAGGAV